jgi:hypothetical protein
MNKITTVTGFILGAGVFALASCSMQEEKAAKPAAMPAAAAPAAKAEAAPMAKAPAKAKAKVQRASGDIGLLDNEKNYVILVTKQGKLITLDFDQKTKVTKYTPAHSKVADIGLGNSAVVTYTTQGPKNVASSIEYKTKK